MSIKLVNFKVDKITKLLLEFDLNENNHIGLLSGKSGIIISLHNYCKSRLLNEDVVYSKIKLIIENCFQELNNNNIDYSFSHGLSGFLWTLNYLIKEGVIDKDIMNFSVFDKYILNRSIFEIENGNFDFIHGGQGGLMYFVDRYNGSKNYKKYINLVVDSINNISVIDRNENINWISRHPETNEPFKYNLGLAQGNASIIAMLSKIVAKGIINNKIKKTLIQSVNSLLMYKLQNKKYFFPNWVDLAGSCENSNSRLAWCNGDLGIAIAIYQASIVMENKEWEEIALKVLFNACDRRNLEKEHVIEAGLCHGTSGIAHIFNRMYLSTGIEKFRETHEFWINETLNKAKFKDGLAGFKVFHGEKYGGWKNTYGLIDGIAGINLALMTSNNTSILNWDKCLMIS
ncbi:MAG: lanthionine synthetase C family protein [Bacteroidota bacterium]